MLTSRHNSIKQNRHSNSSSFVTDATPTLWDNCACPEIVPHSTLARRDLCAKFPYTGMNNYYNIWKPRIAVRNDETECKTLPPESWHHLIHLSNTLLLEATSQLANQPTNLPIQRWPTQNLLCSDTPEFLIFVGPRDLKSHSFESCNFFSIYFMIFFLLELTFSQTLSLWKYFYLSHKQGIFLYEYCTWDYSIPYCVMLWGSR